MKNITKLESDRSDISLDAQELLALARIDMERGALEPALQKIKRLIADPEASSEALALAGRLYAQLGLWDRAEKMFQKYLALEPNAVTETFQLGMVHLDAGRRSEALKIFEDLLKRQPMHPPALFYRALSLVQEGQISSARQALDLLLKSIPADNLYFGRGKELLQSLDAARPPAATTPATDARAGLTKDVYRTEH